MKKMEETAFAFGFVLIICRAGRIVLAVECTAPETSPSTSPTAEHHRSKHHIVFQLASCHLDGESFMFSHFKERTDIFWPQFGRIQNFQVVWQFDVLASGHGLHLGQVAEEYATSDTALGAERRRFDRARLNSFGQTIRFFAARALSVS